MCTFLISAKVHVSGCHDDSVLAQCKAWGQHSKQDNGCQAYASGWSRKGNSCHGCTTTDYAYTACDLNQCHALCDDLYGALYNGRRRRNGHESHRRQCKTGCDKYRELAHNAGLILYDDETPQAIAAVQSEVAALTTEMAELKAGHEMSTTSDSSSETTTASEVAAESTQSGTCTLFAEKYLMLHMSCAVSISSVPRQRRLEFSREQLAVRKSQKAEVYDRHSLCHRIYRCDFRALLSCIPGPKK